MSQPAGEMPSPAVARHGGVTLLKKALRGVALGFVGLGTGRLLAITFQILISRWLGHACFGRFFTGFTFCLILETMASVGLQKGGMRFIAVAREKGDARAARIVARTALLAPILTGLLVAAAGYWLAPLLAGRAFGDPELVPVLQRFALAAPFLSLLRIAADMSRGFGTVQYAVAIEDVSHPLLQLGAFLFLNAAGHSPVAAANAFLAASILCSGLMIVFLFRQVGKFSAGCAGGGEAGFDRGVARSLLRYALPLTPFGILLVLGSFIDIGMLNFFRTATEVGEYGAAARWPMLAAMVAGPLMQMFGPLFAGQHGIGDMGSLELLYKTMTRWMLFILLPVLVFICAARTPLIGLFGPGFSAQTPAVLMILASGVLLSCFSGSAAILLIVTGCQRAELVCLSAGLAVNFVLNLVLIPRHGIVGAAAAMAMGNALTTGGRLLMVHSHLHVQPFGAGLVPLLVVAAAALTGACFTAVWLGPGTGGTLVAASLAAGLTLAASLGIFVLADDRALWAGVISKIRASNGNRPAVEL